MYNERHKVTRPSKISILMILVFLGLLFVPSAMARDFSNFSINIPKTWSMLEQGPTYTFTEPNESCSINITIAPNQGASYNELAILFYQSMQGKNAKGDDGGFSFFIDTKSDVISAARFTYIQDNLAFVVASGTCDNFQNIVQSLNINGSSIRAYPILAPEQNLTSSK